VTRLEVLHGLEAKLARPIVRGGVEGLEQVAHVITGVDTLDDGSGDPPAAATQAGKPQRSGLPRAPAELVHLVAGLLPEERSKLPIGAGGKWMSRADACVATCVVWLRFDSHTMTSGGSMLHWAAKPTRQPARSVPSVVVTMAIG